MRWPLLSVALVVVACSSSNGTDAPPRPCVVDEFEPNDAPTARRSLGSLSDDDDPPLPGSPATTAKNMLRKELSTDREGDIDWFDVDVNDTGFAGNPRISVIVSGTHEATAWFTCSSGATSVVCGLGTLVTNDPDFPSAKGCTTPPATSTSTNTNIMIECDGTSTDSGRLTIRVKRVKPGAACESYSLTVGAE